MLHQDGLPELACCLITRDLCSALHYLHSQVFKMLCNQHLQFHFPGSGPSFPSVFPYSHIWHWSCCIIGSQVKSPLSLEFYSMRLQLLQVLHSIALHWWEQVQLIQLPSSWGGWQPLLACSWNIAAKLTWLQWNQWHLQPCSDPLRNGQRHCAIQRDASHFDALGEVEGCCA